MPMLRPDMKIALKFVARMSVIDRDHITAVQVRCDLIHPIKRGSIEGVFSLGKRALNENKFVAVQTDELLFAIPDQAHRHGVEQFIGKMDAHERLQRIAPLNFLAKSFQRSLLSLLQNRKWLDDSVAQSFEESRRAFLHRLENVARELPIVCALFDNHNVIDFTESFPDFGELRAQ